MLIMKMNVHVHCQDKTTNHSSSCIIVPSWKWHPVYESPSPPQRGICMGEHHYLPANGAMALSCARLTMNSSMGHRLMASPVSFLEHQPVENLQHRRQSLHREQSKGAQHGFWAHWMWDNQWSGNVTGRMLMMMVTVWIFGTCPPTLKTAMTAHIECLSHQSSYKSWAILFGNYHMEAICYISCD